MVIELTQTNSNSTQYIGENHLLQSKIDREESIFEINLCTIFVDYREREHLVVHITFISHNLLSFPIISTIVSLCL